jgi:hypothetical protein
MMVMRQLAYPGQPIPIIGKLLSATIADNGILSDDYNAFGAMRHDHGVPCHCAAGRGRIRQLCAAASDRCADMAFPKLNMAFWVYFCGVFMLTSFPEGARCQRLDLLSAAC